MMKRFIQFGILALVFTAPVLWAQASEDHFEVGAFAEYYRYAYANPVENFIGLGGRGAFNVNEWAQIEAEMAYDFQRNYTATFTNGVTSVSVPSHLRTLHAFFGPKFQTGSGPVRVFITGKVGFDNFSVTNSGPVAGFNNSVGITAGTTAFAVYPGGGIEAFAGPIGIRMEAGDDIFFINGGAHNNLRVSVGPQFRF